MPYLLSPIIKESLPPLWFESSAYERTNIYKIDPDKLPPVNYDKHSFFSHSIAHVEAESHVRKDGRTLDHYFNNVQMLYGPTLVVKLPGNNYKKISENNNLHLWEITINELKNGIENVLKGSRFPGKILLTTSFYPTNSHDYHDPDYVLVLSEEAADYLCSLPNFNLYGTSWKSSDFKPGSSERPIHKKLLDKASILECLDLKDVPEGEYFISAFPLRIQGASESPACPVLFTRDELKF